MVFDIALENYLKEIDEAQLLSKEEEIELANRIAIDNDLQARDLLIRSNLRLVVKIAKKFTGKHLSYADLVEEGNLGLMRAVDTFDPDFGVRFSTYSAWWIKQSIKRSLLLNAQPVHIPTYLVELINQYKHCCARLESILGVAPTLNQIAKDMDIPLRKAQIVKDIVSSIAETTTAATAEEDVDIFDSVCDNKIAQPYLNMLEDEELSRALDLIKKLDAREAQILTFRFGLDGQPPMEINKIAESMQLTRERIRQLYNSAIAKLRKKMTKANS